MSCQYPMSALLTPCVGAMPRRSKLALINELLHQGWKLGDRDALDFYDGESEKVFWPSLFYASALYPRALLDATFIFGKGFHRIVHAMPH
eukprot:1625828-Pyramimonas_sp.AAC.1